MAVMALTPSSGFEVWAARPRVSMLHRTEPLWATTGSSWVGSPTTAASNLGTWAARARAPAFRYSSSALPATTTVARGRSFRIVAIACSIAASEPFVSQAPRP
jgi:hypothetical protein